jgi:hypothetical protein
MKMPDAVFPVKKPELFVEEEITAKKGKKDRLSLIHVAGNIENASAIYYNMMLLTGCGQQCMFLGTMLQDSYVYQG